MACAAGVPVDVMLNRYTPEQFDEVEAFRTIESDPLDRLAEILKRGLAALCRVSGFGADVTPNSLDPDKDGEEVAKPVGPKTAAAILRGTLGG